MSTPGDELVDVVDLDDQVVEVVTRSELRARGLRHRAVYVAVVTSRDELVVHQRADWKDVYPSYWDVCFGGVLNSREGWADGARRELLEEAGIDAEPVELGRAAWADLVLGRIYRVDHDGPFRFDDGEVVAVDRVPLAEVSSWLVGRDVCPDSRDLVLPLLETVS